MTKAILSFLLFCGSLLCHPAIAAGWPQPSGSAFAEEASLQNKPEMSATPNPEQGLPTKTTENDGILDAERLSRARQAETFRPSALILPGAVFTAGAVGVNWDLYARNINLPLKDYAGDLRSKYGKIGADDWVQYAPIISYVVAGAFGAGEHGFTEHLLAGATAYATMGALVNSIKYTVRELRPDGSRRNSFPSGHSATAFMGAELVRLEYGPWWGAGAYTVATGVALLRVYNNRHWFNDLLGGAAIGILSARVGYWLLPLERRMLDRILGPDSSDALHISILPSVASPLNPFPAHGSVMTGPSSVAADPIGHLPVTLSEPIPAGTFSPAFGVSLSCRF